MKQSYYREQVKKFEEYLINEEKSNATIEKYIRDVRKFLTYISSFSEKIIVEKEHTLAYKKYLSDNYSPASTNSMITAMNLFLRFIGKEHCCVRLIKIQRRIYCSEEKELTRAEYIRLIEAAENRGNKRLALLLQTVAGTGIRVSELNFITVESLKRGEAKVSLKGKSRLVFIVRQLRKKLLRYVTEQGIKSGAIFTTRSGRPLNRSNIWREMKTLCVYAGVSPKKVFPHNLRHLFARMFYSMEKDIIKLADILGHSNISTTRIYVITTGAEHRRQMENMCLII